MSFYAYKAREQSGKLVTGRLEAGSEDDLADMLKQKGCVPTSIREISSGFRTENLWTGFVRIKTTDMIMFNVQLANMIEAGLTLLKSLDVISQQITNSGLKSAVNRVRASVAAGSSFSDALAQHPRIFSRLFISMVRAGETGGTLSSTLNRHASYIEQQEEFNQKIRNALFYPTILLVFGIMVIIFIVSFVMPKFIMIFEKANVPLPLPTLFIYGVGVSLKKYWALILLGVLSLIFFIKRHLKTETGRRQADWIVLRFPGIAALARKIIMSRMSRTLAHLIHSGVPLLQALDVTGDVVGNEVIKQEITKARQGVEKGERLTAVLDQSDEFPADMVQMISVGEETGKIDKMLYKIADFYDTVIGYKLKKLVILIEPVFIILMGAMVGVIMASMILPLFDMVKTIQG